MIGDERESRQTAPLFVTHAFLIKAWQVEAGAVWGRGFLPLILKTKHKKDLREKGILNAEDQASSNPSAKGLVNLVLSTPILGESDDVTARGGCWVFASYIFARCAKH